MLDSSLDFPGKSLTHGPDGFDADLESRPRAIPVAVEIDLEDPASPRTLEAFESKIKLLEETGGPVPRAVLLCNPHNPLGTYLYRRSPKSWKD
jgi:hypothetical protein